MTVVEIILGVVMLILSITIIILSLMQPPKQQDMGEALSGSSSSGNFYGKNGGTTREDSLVSLTKIAAALFMIITLVANIISMVKK